MKRFILFTVLLVTVCATALAERLPYEASRTERKQFGCYDDVALYVTNKYGDIDIVTADVKQVEVTIDIKVKAKREGDAKELLDDIHIAFNATKSEVRLATEFPKSWKNSSVEVNYTIVAPKGYAPTLKNMYGNITLSAVTADASVDIRYGNLVASSMMGRTEVISKYGNTTIDGFAELHVDGGYGNIELEEGRNLTLEVGYGNLTVDGIERIDIGDFAYGNVNVKGLKKSFDCDEIAYSGLKISCEEGIERIQIPDGRYLSSAAIYLAKNQKFKGSISVSYGELKFDKLFDCAYRNVETDGGRFSADVSNVDDAMQGAYIDIALRYTSLKIEARE